MRRSWVVTDIKKLLDEALGPKEDAFGILTSGELKENNRIAPLAKEIIVELWEAQKKAIELLLEPHNTGNAYDARILMEQTLAKVEARLRGMK